MKIFLTWLALSIWLLVLAGSLINVSARSQDAALKLYKLVEKPPFSELSPAFVDAVSIGHKGVIDDMLLFYTLNYLMDSRLRGADPAEVQMALKATTRLHPKIETIYMFGCLVLALEMKHPEACEPLITDGINLFPDGWRLPVTLGTILFHTMKDDAKAAIFYEIAAQKPDAPAFAKSLAIKLRNRAKPDPVELEALIQTIGTSFGEDMVRKFYSTGGDQK